MSFPHTGSSHVFSPHLEWSPNFGLCPTGLYSSGPRHLSEALKHTSPGVLYLWLDRITVYQYII